MHRSKFRRTIRQFPGPSTHPDGAPACMRHICTEDCRISVTSCKHRHLGYVGMSLQSEGVTPAIVCKPCLRATQRWQWELKLKYHVMCLALERGRAEGRLVCRNPDLANIHALSLTSHTLTPRSSTHYHRTIQHHAPRVGLLKHATWLSLKSRLLSRAQCHGSHRPP